jgi:hypothetical protein
LFLTAPLAELQGAEIIAQLQAITQTLREHFDQVVAWRAGTPKTWGFLAGKAVGNARRLAGRSLSDAERRRCGQRCGRRCRSCTGRCDGWGVLGLASARAVERTA